LLARGGIQEGQAEPLHLSEMWPYLRNLDHSPESVYRKAERKHKLYSLLSGMGANNEA
jgi:hypothetical protein